jgi:hypothetical protein
MKEALTKFWTFLKKDSWASLAVTLLIAFILILFVFFPLLQWTTGTSLPLVIVESCSMYHDETGFESIIGKSAYSQNEINLEDTKDWDFQKGLTKGDIVFVIGTKKPKQGDVVIFIPNEDARTGKQIIHRIVDDAEPYGTLGDNNPSQLRRGNNQNNIEETIIYQNQIMGKAVFKIPYLGWIKLIFFDFGSDNAGVCKN